MQWLNQFQFSDYLVANQQTNNAKQPPIFLSLQYPLTSNVTGFARLRRVRPCADGFVLRERNAGPVLRCLRFGFSCTTSSSSGDV
jgi:hypothetical protein